MNAVIKTPLGTFKGIVISDDVDKWQGTLLGAIFSLTPTPEQTWLLGNSTGYVKFSREAISNALKFAHPLGFGYGKHRVPIVSWLE